MQSLKHISLAIAILLFSNAGFGQTPTIKGTDPFPEKRMFDILPNVGYQMPCIVNKTNTTFGFNAGSPYIGTHNTFFGTQTGYSLTNSGVGNVLMGSYAGYYITSGDYNIGIGRNAVRYCGITNNNVGIGSFALEQSDSGNNNTALGNNAGRSNSTGSSNVMLGYYAGGLKKTGNSSIAIGANAGRRDNASGNVFIGANSGMYNEKNIENTFVGFNTGRVSGRLTSITASQNTFIGYNAGANNRGGGFNAFFGNRAAKSNTEGNQNTVIGSNANIKDSQNNSASFGYAAYVSTSNTQVFGNNKVTRWGFGVNPASGKVFQIGTNATNGNGWFVSNGGTSYNTSDRTKKENITTLNYKEILKKVNELEVTQWNYKGEDANIRHIGPMAQDFYSTFNVGFNNTSISTIDPAGVALAAIKGMYEEVKALQEEVRALKNELAVVKGNGSDVKNGSALFNLNPLDVAINPNPVMDQANIMVKGDAGKQYRYQVINNLGIVIVADVINANQLKTIPVSNIAGGTYQVNILEGNNVIATKPLVINK